MKLSQEEKDELLALMTSAGWNVMKKVLNHQAHRFAERVMNYTLTDGPEGLVIEKARAEGAKQAVEGIIKFRNSEVRDA